jgi:hypothetical protein
LACGPAVLQVFVGLQKATPGKREVWRLKNNMGVNKDIAEQ